MKIAERPRRNPKVVDRNTVMEVPSLSKEHLLQGQD